MYAVFETGGKQYRAAAGDLVKVEMLGEEDGATVTFDRVLLVNQDGKVVTAEQKDKKVVVFKMKRRKHSRTKNGHRQRHSIVKITGINA